jgi:RecJ-like exonuclease
MSLASFTPGEMTMDRRDRSAMNGGNKIPVHIDADGIEHKMPVKFEVCFLCDGHGKHVNPSIDAHGISGDDFAADPGFADEYFGGTYDVPCNECHGKRVIHVVDRDNCDSDLLAAYDAETQEQRDFEIMQEAERRMGC